MAAAMAAVVALLIVGLMLLGHRAMRIGRASAGVVGNALPSTIHLDKARAAVRAIDVDMNKAIVGLAEGRPLDRAPFERHRRVLGDELGAYRALPADSGEPELFDEVLANLKRFDATLEEELRLLASGDLRRAGTFEVGTWSAATDRLYRSIRALHLLNSQEMEAHTAAIDHDWRVVVIGAAALGLSCVALSLFSGALAIRAMRRHERFLEDRAGELELFSARIAHDLMSPLGSVAIALQVAEQNSRDPEIVRLSRRATTSMRRLQGIVASLLGFARAGGRPAPATTSLAFIPDLLDELRPIAEEARVELSSGPIPSVEVACAAGILSVLVSNLVRNSIQWMGNSPVRRVELRVTAGEHRVRFEVHDTGPGLPEELQHRLFEPFARPAPTGIPGVSLGLATVKRMVDAHGGVVGMRPAGPQGTVFWFELPRAAGERAAG